MVYFRGGHGVILVPHFSMRVQNVNSKAISINRQEVHYVVSISLSKMH